MYAFQLLNVAAPPYDPVFMNCLHPLVSHPHIIDGLQAGRNTDVVKEFLGELSRHSYAPSDLNKSSINIIFPF